MVTECTVKRIGDLPFDFSGGGTCGTFMINSLSTTLFCFNWTSVKATRQCLSLTRKNDGALSEDFVFDAEFEVNKVAIPDSAHMHWKATIANYLGLPMILGGLTGGLSEGDKLEILNTIENPPRWIEYEGTDYPYSNM